MRKALIVASLLLLGACNMVITKTPLFAKADTVGAPQLRAGIWAEKSTEPCDVDETKPLAEWPDCAKAFLVLDGKVGGYKVDANGKSAFSSTQMFMVGGSPQVIQVQMEDLDVKGLGDVPLGPMYLYMAVRPTKTDAGGRVTAYVAWPVLCGPPPPPDAKTPSGGTQTGTLKPLAGLTMDGDGNNCTTTSKDAVRAAAAVSEKWTPAETLTVEHWVRDGDR